MNTDAFAYRHIGPDNEETNEMLREIDCDSLDKLIDSTVPTNIRLKEPLKIPESLTEYEYAAHIEEIARKNKVFRSYLGLGYSNCIVPAVIRRNILENPGWYTAYTPYQAEISQGRLEALLNFQTLVSDVTAMPIANASLLDEATAAAEAMIMLFHSRIPEKQDCSEFFVADDCLPQTIEVLKTRANPIGITITIGNPFKADTTKLFGILLQYPGVNGKVTDCAELVRTLHQRNIFVAVAADLLSLVLFTPPGEWGADVVVGNTQRFGVPLGFGGPHAAYFGARENFKRLLPGRIIGVTIDAGDKRAYRMALQTREQHIRREKATSNICTAQVLLAIMAGMYAVYHGPRGLKNIAKKIHSHTFILSTSLESLGYPISNALYFDTIEVKLPAGITLKAIKDLAEKKEINFFYSSENRIRISLDETVSENDLKDIIGIFANAVGKESSLAGNYEANGKESPLEVSNLMRKTPFLLHPVFNTHHSETEMMRYIKQLENKDISLTRSMISLGSCTMKLNAASELYPITMPAFANLHPFAPADQAKGYDKILHSLEKYLCSITGFSAVSFQPNSGAQGEYAGLLAIRAYHHSRGDVHRNIALIPSSAHGTNPASAAMAGMQIVVIKCEESGDIDLKDLKEKVSLYKNNLSCIMVTYPSTFGVFEDAITEVTRIVHRNGGLVYMDGANMNAQVGLTSPNRIGADVCHLNLHKTFSIPHGGGGPGMGPIAVTKKLIPFLPSHPFSSSGITAVGAISSSPYSSALILLISYGYIRMLGVSGITEASKYAILNANYIRARLNGQFEVLYKGTMGNVAHELILDCNQFKKTADVDVTDIAKRMIDYGYHAPTVAFPVHDTLMVEPTECESKAELDRFIEVMISIRNEIREIEEGKSNRIDNVLKNAPHTAESLITDDWRHMYSREKAAYPLPWLKENKYWVPVSRADNAYGDRNLMCTCPPIEEYMKEGVAEMEVQG